MCYPTHKVRISLLASIVGCVVAMSATASAASPADVAAADALFREARASAKKGDYATACPKFRESYRLDPTVGTLLNTADCEEHDDRLADAKARFQEALDRLAPTDDRVTYVRSRIHALDERISENARREAEKPAPAPTPATVLVKPAPAPPSRALPIALGGVGVAAGVATGVFVGLMFHQKHIADAHCQGSQCDQAGIDATSTGKTYGTLGGVTFGVSAVAFAVATYFLVRGSGHSGPDHVAIGDYVLGGSL